MIADKLYKLSKAERSSSQEAWEKIEIALSLPFILDKFTTIECNPGGGILIQNDTLSLTQLLC